MAENCKKSIVMGTLQNCVGGDGDVGRFGDDMGGRKEGRSIGMGVDIGDDGISVGPVG